MLGRNKCFCHCNELHFSIIGTYCNLEIHRLLQQLNFEHVLFRDGAEFEEQKIVTASRHPVSALCALPPSSDSEQLGLIAVASGTDYTVRIYRPDETSPLYQLQGHTDTGSQVHCVCVYSCQILCSWSQLHQH